MQRSCGRNLLEGLRRGLCGRTEQSKGNRRWAGSQQIRPIICWSYQLSAYSEPGAPCTQSGTTTDREHSSVGKVKGKVIHSHGVGWGMRGLEGSSELRVEEQLWAQALKQEQLGVTAER